MSFWIDVPFEFWTVCCLEPSTFDTSHPILAPFLNSPWLWNSLRHSYHLLLNFFWITNYSCSGNIEGVEKESSKLNTKAHKYFRTSYAPAILLDVSTRQKVVWWVTAALGGKFTFLQLAIQRLDTAMGGNSEKVKRWGRKMYCFLFPPPHATWLFSEGEHRLPISRNMNENSHSFWFFSLFSYTAVQVNVCLCPGCSWELWVVLAIMWMLCSLC